MNTSVKTFREIYSIRERYSKNRHSETLHRYNRIEQLVKLRHNLNIQLSNLKDKIATKRFEEKLIIMDKFYKRQIENIGEDIKKLNSDKK